MNQTRLQSLVEALVNTFIGFFITMSVLPLINWLLGIQMNLTQASLSTILFTLVSILRGYVVRRFFNNFHSIKSKIINLIKRIQKDDESTTTN